VGRARDELGRFTSSAGKAEEGSKKLTSATSILATAAKAAAAAFAAWKVYEHVKEMAMLAARYETLGVVMRVAGNNAGYTNAQMLEYQKTLEKSGISMTQARNSLIQMSTASINLANASKLARAAQDLAVVGNINSSEALGRMVGAIQSGEIEVLKTMGMNVQWEAGYVKLAVQLHKNKDQLTEQEKTMARTNTVLQEAIKFQGIYEEAMGTAGKQMTSLTRYWEDLKLKMGDAFLPALTQAVHDLTDGLKASNVELEKAGQAGIIDSIGKGLATAFKTVYEAVVVLAANIGFVFQQIGTGIGGAAAQAQAFLSGDWKRIPLIREQMVTDLNAQRSALDAFEAKILHTGKVAVVSTEEEAKAIAERNIKLAEAEQVRIRAGEAARDKAAKDAKALKDQEKALELQKKYDEQYKGLIKTISEKTAESMLDMATQGKLTDGQKYAVKILDDLRTGELKLSDAKKIKLAQGLEEMLRQERLRMAQDADAKATQDELDRSNAEVTAIFDKVRALDEEIDTYGMSTAAISRRTAAKLREQAASFEISASEQAALEAKAKAMDMLAERQGHLGTMNAAKKEAEEATVAWNKFYSDMSTGLTDALMRGFEKGKSFAENFRDTLVNMFQTMVLRPTIQGILSPVASGATSMFSGVGSAASTASSGADLLSSLGSAGSMYSAYSASSLGQFMSGFSGSAGAASQMLGGAPLTNAANYGQMASNGLSGIGGAVPYLGMAGGGFAAYNTAEHIGGVRGAVAGGAMGAGTIAAGGALAGLAGGGTAMAGATAALAAVPVWGWIAIAALAILGGMQDGPEQATRLAFGSNNQAGAISINERGNEGKSNEYVADVGSKGAFGTFGVVSTFWMEAAQPAVQSFVKTVTDTDDALAKFMSAAEKNTVTNTLTGHVMTSNSGAEGSDPNGLGGLDAVFRDRIKTIFDVIDPQLNGLLDSFKGNAQELGAEAAALLGFRSALRDTGEAVFGAKVTLMELAELRLPTEAVSSALARVTAEFSITNAVALSLGKTTEQAFGAVGLASLKARETLITAAGGIDALAEKAGTFAQNFLTEAERNAPVLESVNKTLAAMGYTCIDTRDEFKALVLGLNLTTAEGATTYSKLMDIAAAFAQVHPAVEAATQSVKTLADARKDLTDAYERESSVLQDTVDRMENFAKAIQSFKSSLLLGSSSTLSPEQKYAEAQKQLANATPEEFQSAATAFLAASRDYNGSTEAYARDFALVQKMASEQIKVASSQADVARGQLSVLQESVRGLIDINKSVLSVRDAILAVYAAQGAKPQSVADLQQQLADTAAGKIWSEKDQGKNYMAHHPASNNFEYQSQAVADPLAAVLLAKIDERLADVNTTLQEANIQRGEAALEQNARIDDLSDQVTGLKRELARG
jgi:hypothetical protein